MGKEVLIQCLFSIMDFKHLIFFFVFSLVCQSLESDLDKLFLSLLLSVNNPNYFCADGLFFIMDFLEKGSLKYQLLP